MSDETQSEATENEATEEEAAPEAEAQETDAIEAPEAVEESDPATEIAELKDKLLRAMADAENQRRIATREKEKAAKYAISTFARDMLSVADYLGMAMMSVSDEARQTDQNLNNLCVGVEMTQKELLNVFERAGIKPVPAEGQPFDHNIHEAVQQQENPDVPANTVLQVMRGGYIIQDRLLRPAQVIVSTGGAKQNGADEPGEVEASASESPEAPEAYESGGPEAGQSVDQET